MTQMNLLEWLETPQETTEPPSNADFLQAAKNQFMHRPGVAGVAWKTWDEENNCWYDRYDTIIISTTNPNNIIQNDFEYGGRAARIEVVFNRPHGDWHACYDK